MHNESEAQNLNKILKYKIENIKIFDYSKTSQDIGNFCLEIFLEKLYYMDYL